MRQNGIYKRIYLVYQENWFCNLVISYTHPMDEKITVLYNINLNAFQKTLFSSTTSHNQLQLNRDNHLSSTIGHNATQARFSAPLSWNKHHPL